MNRKRALGIFLLFVAIGLVITFITYQVRRRNHQKTLLKQQQQQQRQQQIQEQQQQRQRQQQQQRQQQPEEVDIVLTKVAWPDEAVLELEWDPRQISKENIDALRQSLNRLFGVDLACWKPSKDNINNNNNNKNNYYNYYYYQSQQQQKNKATLEMKLPPGFGGIEPIQKHIEKRGIKIVATRQAISAERQRSLLNEATQDFSLEQLNNQRRALQVHAGIPQVQLHRQGKNSIVTLKAKGKAILG